ncbi:GNAT family N-acetyltransferase [Pullulanibacillus sp. KACC 23026]|uniref:GNAT family N-acetyltransferase n=1 Tax=Pullulanibacillus sp. KACC 23026 TaxID=3028315 RepID=UPI0023AECA76|nr:GNAT family N-acetyltransferase [Pullulanibacillus sp. KACC 23026]WEG14434.1 GNAT family N-acetyltransferase [Pullulanibacillus sp. KACC 23026]
MLDKSLPYFNIIMKRPSGTPPFHFELPQGYTFTEFTQGTENQWAEIETSVGEFETVGDALHYFHTHYLPFSDELKKRLLFVQNKEGEKVGTITGWFDHLDQKQVPSIHWFAVKESDQGYGLGKALVSECLNKLLNLDGNRDVFLHTQTWSYKAIALYLKAGFELVKEGTFAHYKNDYEQAIPILKQVVKL